MFGYYQSFFPYHFIYFPVFSRIAYIRPTGKHSHCFSAGIQCSCMGVSVNPGSHAAYDCHLVLSKHPAYPQSSLPSVFTALSCSYHCSRDAFYQCDIPRKIYGIRRIFYVFQQFRIFPVTYPYALYIITDVHNYSPMFSVPKVLHTDVLL